MNETFEGDFKLKFHLAPPLLARRDPETGELKKREFGPWMLPVFRHLAKLKRLRGTPLDVFGYTQERRTERQLIKDYEATVATLIDAVTPENLALCVEIASVPERIRGYGPYQGSQHPAGQTVRVRAARRVAQPGTVARHQRGRIDVRSAPENPYRCLNSAPFSRKIIDMIARMRAIALGLAVLMAPLGAVWYWLSDLPRYQHSIDDRLSQFGTAARTRLLSQFLRAGVPYPPAQVVFLGLKDERRLDIYAAGHKGGLRHISSYRVVAAAGGPGPKLREGDRQVPEGIYDFRYLNPNSVAYVSLMIGYPNAFDKARAKADGRTKLGGDIVIHGPTVGTEGCLALDDVGMEDVFTLVADTGVANTEIVLAPHDLRAREPSPKLVSNKWDRALYARLAAKLAQLPTGAEPAAASSAKRQ